MKTITVLLPEDDLDGLHELVRQKKYINRSDCIRAALRDFLNKKRRGEHLE